MGRFERIVIDRGGMIKNAANYRHHSQPIEKEENATML